MSKAIPTTYNGVQYRSILEARWAAFFQLSHINAEYEPEAFAGYIPDFMIRTESQALGALVVEIKGSLENFDLLKIRRSGWTGDVWCCTGEGPSSVLPFDRRHQDVPRPLWTPGCLVMRTSLNSDTAWLFRWSFDGDEQRVRDWFNDRWKEAGNLVQWRSPRRGRAA
ncbi:MAG: hypothetical protein V4593_08195 [Pseudomonadota bacterium]